MTHDPRDPVCMCAGCDSERRATIIARTEAYFAARAKPTVGCKCERCSLLESGMRPTVRPPRMARNATQQA